MDFVVARFHDKYGFISTDKNKKHGFDIDYKHLMKRLEEFDKDFTYTTPEELAVHDHQREWTAKDRIHYNKLKYMSDQYDRDLAQIMLLSRGLGR